MPQVRAFVGHSFSSNDSIVVGKFEKYLNQIALLHPNFFWQHAELAEPIVIDEKVLRLFDDKELFIGICTRKERVINPDVLSPSRFGQTRLSAPKRHFEWKTSDWIIQEIGLAIGRGIPVILLIEEGLRPPGALQGNLEHIGFDRSAPEKCFGKLLEMISVFSPRVSSSLVAEVDARSSPPEEESETVTPKNVDWTVPQANWKTHDFEFAYMHFVATKDNEKAKSIGEKYGESQLAVDEQSKKMWEAFKEYVAIVLGSGGSLRKLHRIVDEYPENSTVLNYLARSYEVYEEFQKAAEAFEKAAYSAEKVKTKLSLLGMATLSYRKVKSIRSSDSCMALMKKISIENNAGEDEILEAELKIAEFTKEIEVAVGAMERKLEIDPSNTNARFALAYKYSERNLDDLAYFHYQKIPFAERSAVTWNNIGVARDELELHVKAVQAYRKSEELGETLAMSNLANKLLKVGFLKEAQEICDTALKLDGYHKNIGRTLGQLKSANENEDKKEESILRDAKPISDFYREFGAALARPNSGDLDSVWVGPDSSLAVSIVGKEFTAKGSYERSQMGLRTLAYLGLGGSSETSKSSSAKYTVEYRGVITGAGIVGTIIRRRDGEAESSGSLLGSGEEQPSVIMIIEGTGEKIKVLERLKKTNRFYDLVVKK